MLATEVEPRQLEGWPYREVDRKALKVLRQVGARRTITDKAQACVGWQPLQHAFQCLQILLCAPSRQYVTLTVAQFETLWQSGSDECQFHWQLQRENGRKACYVSL